MDPDVPITTIATTHLCASKRKLDAMTLVSVAQAKNSRNAAENKRFRDQAAEQSPNLISQSNSHKLEYEIYRVLIIRDCYPLLAMLVPSI